MERPADCLLAFPNASLRQSAENMVHSHPRWDSDLEFHLDNLQEWTRFVAHVLDHGKATPSRIAGRIAQVAIASRVAESASGIFVRAKNTLGFHERLADLITELLGAGLTPSQLEEGAQRAEVLDSRFPQKANSIAALWREYARTLSKLDMSLPAEMQVRACDIVTNTPIPGDELWLDGFRYLTQVQIDLLSLLAADRRVGITLAWDRGKSDLFVGTVTLLRRLEERFEIVWVDVADAPTKHRTQTMRSLSQELFQLDHPPGEWDRKVHILDCPNRLAEVEWLARRILKKQSEEGLESGDFAVVARGMDTYGPILEQVLPRFGLAASRVVERRAIDNPFVRFLLDVIALIRDDWPREAVYGVIGSTYAWTREDQASLRAELRNARPRNGLEYWRRRAKEMVVECRPAERLSHLASWSVKFEGRQTPLDFATHTRDMFNELGWLDRANEAGAPHRREDFVAGEVALRAADALSEIEAIGGESKMRLGRFLALWTRMCTLSRYRTEERHAGIRIVESPDEIGSPPKVAMMLGLLEGVFPRRMTEDPFLNDEERLELRRVTGCHLSTGVERTEDERLRFCLSATLPTDELFLFYPRTDENSESIPTLYLDDVRNSVPQPYLDEESILLAPPSTADTFQSSQLAPDLKYALTAGDRLLAAAADAPGALEAASIDVPEVAEMLESWRKLPRLPKLHDPDAVVRAQRKPGAVSVTELESLSRCPFQHWAQYSAMLRPSSFGVTRADQGSLIHRILARAMRLTEGALFERLMKQLDVELEDLALEVGEWEYDLLRAYATKLLGEFAEREEAFQRAHGLVPERFEWRFGGQSEEEIRDPTSMVKALTLELDDVGELMLAGSIDRVDRDPQSGAVVVMDYKLGAATPNRLKAMEEGDSLQMPFYVLAARELLGSAAVGAGYDGLERNQRFLLTPMLPDRKFPSAGLPDGSEARVMADKRWDEIIATAKGKAAAAIRMYQNADITPHPTPDGCRTCSYGDLCRWKFPPGRHDGEQPEEDPID